MNVIPTMKKRKAQSIEQVKDKKRLSYIPHQKKIFKLKIEKIKNSNFELKKTEVIPIIQMQKAQSFEQPRDFNFKPKNKNKNLKFEISQIRDCDIELIGKPNLSIDCEANISYHNNNNKKNIFQYKKKQTNFNSIPKPYNKDLDRYEDFDCD